MSEHSHKVVALDILSVKESGDIGEFVGLASVYGNEDLQGDVVERGAFVATLKEKGGKVPLLWMHQTDAPIGLGELEDTSRGLLVRGRLPLVVTKAREAYTLMKQGAVRGLSIGYDVVKHAFEGRVRKLKEVRLWEVSIVTFPANPEALVQTVKAGDRIEETLTCWAMSADLRKMREELALTGIRSILREMQHDR